MTTDRPAIDPERADIQSALRKQRSFLLRTVHELSDEQARLRSTVSELCLGGLIKHVAGVEEHWASFIVEGPKRTGSPGPEEMQAHADSFKMLDDETLAVILQEYDRVAAVTDDLVASLPSLDADQPLPEAPWFPPKASWSARTVFLHIIGETAHHSGHADIIREAIDGQKTMG